MSLIDIIIPTMNNWEYLLPCLQSIVYHKSTPGLARIIVVNNGHKDSIPKEIGSDATPEITVLQPGKNLGWEGGLKLGLENSKAQFAVFMNDDTYIPYSSAGWLLQMLERFSDGKVAAVGPSSNCVMGMQNIFIPETKNFLIEVNMLIGFCLMVRRSALDEVGGVDDSMPNHGDDLDLSIRFRKAGYKLLCDKGVFVFHHGFKTGQREHGAEWNSIQMTEKTNHWLIRKHGLKEFVKHIFNPVVGGAEEYVQEIDSEGNVVRKYATGDVLELGCGNQKTVEPSIGLDIVPKGEFIPGLIQKRSIADIVADIHEPLPIENEKFDTLIARHLLEHLIDPVRVLKDWRRVIKPGGRLILAVPDQSKRHTITMNYQHVHAYTPDSLKNLMESQGWHTEAVEDANNNISLVGIFTRNGVENGHQ